MFKTFVYFVCLYFTVLIVINGQTLIPTETLPPLETLPPDTSMNTSSIVSPYDESCINADNSTDNSADIVVYLGAVALNNDNECEVICQKQILQSFQIMYFGIVRTRAVITGSIFTASMPDNFTCAQTGTCTGGLCSVNANTTAMPMTTMASNSTEMTTMLSNSTEMAENSTEVMTNTTETTNSTVTPMIA